MSFVNDQIKFKWQIMYYMNLFYNQRVQKKQRETEALHQRCFDLKGYHNSD